MLQYVVKRLLSTIPVLLGISLLLFFMLRMLPGDPAQVLAGQMATPEEIENIRHQLGLDRPIHVQYAFFLSRLALTLKYPAGRISSANSASSMLDRASTLMAPASSSRARAFSTLVQLVFCVSRAPRQISSFRSRGGRRSRAGHQC